MKWLAAVFGVLVRLRNRLYDRGWLRARRAPVPVICAGALEAGGAGKTPLALLFAERIAARGLRVALVSRGYRGALERRGGRVSPTDDAARVGDEPLLLARRLPSVPVYVGRDRVAMARLAAAEGARAIVLDDGFQHRALARDLDAVIVDGGADLSHRSLLPAGPLREPIAGLSRAGLLVVRGEGPPPPGHAGALVRVADEAVDAVRHPTGEVVGLEALRGRPVTLVAGIARPDRFAALARALGAVVLEERWFPDHHRFAARDLAGTRGEILTTEKDAARWPPGVAALVLRHRLRVVEGEEALEAAIDEALRRGRETAS